MKQKHFWLIARTHIHEKKIIGKSILSTLSIYIHNGKKVSVIVIFPSPSTKMFQSL